MRRRHIEWLNIHNSNCDADERVRRPKRQLLRELEEWENTQGGKADVKESKFMRKDFDGTGYAKSHKSDFDDLIAQARKKRAVPKPADEKEANGDRDTDAQQSSPEHPDAQVEMSDALHNEERSPQSRQANGVQSQGLDNHGTDLRARQDGAQIPFHATASPLAQQAESAAQSHNEPPLGLQNPLGSPSRTLPMFAMSEDPVKEVDLSTT
jgi:E3 ubiquitin-protein ligase RAD18